MFFDRLKKLCDEKGISTYKACTDVGLNRAAVAKWKNGSIPSGSTAAKLADYFGVTTDYLLGKEEESTFLSSSFDYDAYCEQLLPPWIKGAEREECLRSMKEMTTPGQIAKITLGQPKLTEGEKKLIQLFRQVPKDRQAMVIQMIEAALKNL